MIRELFTNIKPKPEHYMLVVAALLILAAWVGLAQRVPSKISESSSLDQVGPALQPMGNEASADTSSINLQPLGKMRPADEYSAQLAQLGQKARASSRLSDATAYDIRLEELSRRGRAAIGATRLPASAKEYAYYLDHLRNLAQNAHTASIEPVDANAFSAYLDQLRRLASEASVVNTQEGK